MNKQGFPVQTLCNMYVDENLIAEIKPRMLQAMSASIEALFIFMSRLEPHKRKSDVHMKMFLEAVCA